MTDSNSSVKFRPPAPLRIGANFRLEDWQKWLKSYRWYSGAANLSKMSPDEQLSSLKGMMGPEALSIWGNFSFYDTSDVESVLAKFEEHFTPKFNVPLERLNFNRLVQQPGQSFDDFLSSAVAQVDKCDFGGMREDFLRDKIVAGIEDDELRMKLLGEGDLTFDKAVEMCRTAKNPPAVQKKVKKEPVAAEPEPETAEETCELTVIRPVRPDRRAKRKDRNYEEKPFVCGVPACTFRTVHQKSLDRHMKIHKGEKRHSCSICGYRSAVMSNVRDHMKTHSGEKPFKCYHCGFRCALKGYIRNHIKVHIGDKPFACGECDYKSNRLESLNRHKLRHTGEKPFACEVCEFRCSQKSSMKIHMRGHTGEKPYACDECEYRSIVPEKLRIHKMRCHTGEKPYACDFCEIGFADQGSLRQHRRTHTGERPYTCDVCGYKCALRGNLRKHMIRHTGEKPYACHLCDYRSAQPSTLKVHLKTHSGEKPNVCHICGHRCAHKGNLKKHMLTHTGERPYACHVCPYRSAQSSGLKTHMKTHTGEKPYVCDICGFRCAHNGNLKQHLKTHKVAPPEAEAPCQWPETFQPMNSSECPSECSTISITFPMADTNGLPSGQAPSAHVMSSVLPVRTTVCHSDPLAPSSTHEMSNNVMPLSSSSHSNVTPLSGGTLQASNAHNILQVSSMQCPCTTHSNTIAVPSVQQSPFHHSYTTCHSSLGQST